ncbi:protein of unknown function [Candidatus Nitrosotalea okcheonensis]|uniref:Uncharacterized protein n=1 Tax=Candidatus Nitrosotalea okcheonensis TaxID=1903276 RepID=A0A2H1FCP4_9ARCH|nr:protein of unknown function [Candidatus Nitrosotalea okcheonensis]
MGIQSLKSKMFHKNFSQNIQNNGIIQTTLYIINKILHDYPTCYFMLKLLQHVSILP